MKQDEQPHWETPRLVELGTPGVAHGLDCLNGSGPGSGSTCRQGLSAGVGCKTGFGDSTKCNPGRTKF